ncbi:FAD-binding protein [Mesosutterella sp. OilRF-GAM-744-9]|uniref:FAD-binding protein n=1 Tax=Mesosutterella porci TaxID=2915351 RepID=A0ABS9MSD7_9BURK|nr:FAD-binding protein [Mesosutterella sp. oilRF-744-WT-GAM-9]MCG5031525.1 FAD-binding protein [Mesosutterella sp. oilRF-744-WT-GAM-9]
MTVDLSRRAAFKAAAASALAIPAASSVAKPLDESIKWDRETDALVIGFGGAGACAAIAAHDSGARVLIVEKMRRKAATRRLPPAAS